MTVKASRKVSKRSSVNHHKPMLQSFLLVIISLVIAIVLYQTGWFHQLISALDSFGYIGALLAGMFFVSIFTAAPAAIVLLTLAESLPVLPLILIAGVGTVVGDMLILFVMSRGVKTGIHFFPQEKGIQKIIKTLRHTKYRFLLTVIGAIVIASPLPDELGMALMGLSKQHIATTMVLTFVLNSLGLWLLFVFFGII